MFARIRSRLGVALLGAAIAVILNLTLLACSSITSTGAATGAADSQGTAGPAAGLRTQVVQTAIGVPAGQTGQATATCPAGTVVTGGGYWAWDTLRIFANKPAVSGWYVSAYNPDESQARPLTAYAVCASLSQ